MVPNAIVLACCACQRLALGLFASPLRVGLIYFVNIKSYNIAFELDCHYYSTKG